jgi:hypothetical protein
VAAHRGSGRRRGAPRRAQVRRELLASYTGRRLEGGILLHGAFFSGRAAFTRHCAILPESERRQFSMGGVSFTNQLDGHDPALKLAQRRHGASSTRR